MIHTLLILQWPKILWLRREPRYPQKSAPGRNKFDHYAIKFPSTSESAAKITEGTAHLVFTVDVKANKDH